MGRDTNGDRRDAGQPRRISAVLDRTEPRDRPLWRHEREELGGHVGRPGRCVLVERARCVEEIGEQRRRFREQPQRELAVHRVAPDRDMGEHADRLVRHVEGVGAPHQCGATTTRLADEDHALRISGYFLNAHAAARKSSVPIPATVFDTPNSRANQPAAAEPMG